MSDLFDKRVEAAARALCDYATGTDAVTGKRVDSDYHRAHVDRVWHRWVNEARRALLAADAVEGVAVVPTQVISELFGYILPEDKANALEMLNRKSAAARPRS